MENTNIVTTEQQAPNTISASNAIFNVQALSQLTAFANLMADSKVTVPEHLAGKPADCMAIVMQAMQWGMNPYAVAQKTHLVNGALGYEAQLVNAVIASSSAIRGRFHYRYGGEWERCTKTKEVQKEKTGKNGKYTITERVRDWTDEDEVGLYVQVGAILRGESEITWGEPIYLSGVVIRNSPLWVSNPKQQIAYLGVKYWGRLYCPEVILGVYSPDELEEREEKVINPVSSDSPHNTVIEDKPSVNVDVLADELRQKIDEAETVEEAKQIRSDIESSKSSLGALYNELKSKAVKRYRFVEARNSVEAAFNSLPRPDEPDATACFAVVEKSLEYAKKHLGDDLYSQYLINLNDIRPEYITA